MRPAANVWRVRYLSLVGLTGAIAFSFVTILIALSLTDSPLRHNAATAVCMLMLVVAFIVVLYRADQARCRLHLTINSSGRCFRCGYDLRATPSRCPECGERPMGE